MNMRRCVHAPRRSSIQKSARRSGRLLTAIAACAPALAGGSISLAQTPNQSVSASQTMRAYKSLDGWIRSWSAPSEAQAIDPDGATGACVTLRLAGAVVARATVMQSDGESIWRAAQMAIVEAADHMPVERDALRDESLIRFAQRLTIDLQVAGQLVPLSGATIGDIASRLSPGLDGVAARKGERIEAVFPGAQLATNSSPAQALIGAISDLGLPSLALGDPRLSLSKLRKEQGLTLHRFRAQQLAQIDPASPPLFLRRGGRALSMRDVTGASLRSFGDAIANHLLTHRWPGEEPFGLMGTYKPWSDAYEPPIVGDPAAQALTALALARWSHVAQGGPDEPPDPRLIDAAQSILLDLADVAPGEQSVDDDAAACAMIVMASLELDAEQSPPKLVDFVQRRCRPRVLASFDAKSGFEQSLKSPSRRAVIAACMARLVQSHDAEADADAASLAVRSLLRSSTPGSLPGLMPWIGWAQLWLVDDAQAVPAAVAFRDLRSMLWRRQITYADRGASEPDLVGGVVFSTSPTPLPTWQMMRPLAFVATMLGDRRLTDDAELPQELARLLTSLRFVRQLAINREQLHMCRNPDRAIGGVRLALWDQRLSLESSSIALLSVAETIRALEARSKARQAVSGERPATDRRQSQPEQP